MQVTLEDLKGFRQGVPSPNPCCIKFCLSKMIRLPAYQLLTVRNLGKTLLNCLCQKPSKPICCETLQQLPRPTSPLSLSLQYFPPLASFPILYFSSFILFAFSSCSTTRFTVDGLKSSKSEPRNRLVSNLQVTVI